MILEPVLKAGTVYGVLLNSNEEWLAWKPLMNELPYKNAPQSPVLYVKSANTWSACGTAIGVPTSSPQVEVGACLGMVIGSNARSIHASQAISHVAGYVLLNDMSLPHASFYRPPVKYKNLDGFLGIGPRLATSAEIINPSQVKIEVRIDGQLRQTFSGSQMRRSAAQLLTDVSEFMTLHRGDVLLLGLGANRPLASVGQRIDIRALGLDALGTLTNTLVQEVS